tara:strand:- start:2480 stop:2662 length:183 start_codon:yes stop_codon:yes gene_type:complete
MQITASKPFTADVEVDEDRLDEPDYVEEIQEKLCKMADEYEKTVGIEWVVTSADDDRMVE